MKFGWIFLNHPTFTSFHFIYCKMIFVFHQIEMVWVKCQGLNEIPPLFHHFFGVFFTWWFSLGFPDRLRQLLAQELRTSWGKVKPGKLSLKKSYEATEDLDVSKNSGTPKSSILIGFSIINHPFWGTRIFGNTHLKGKNKSFSTQNAFEVVICQSFLLDLI